MKTYVINLPRAADRRAIMEERLSGLGLDHEFVDGVDGAALSQAERARLVDEAAVGRFPWWSTPGMIGCSLSHKRVYDLIVARGDAHALVLEDDVMLDPDVGPLADALAAEMRTGEVLLMNFRSHSSVPCRLRGAGAVQVGGRAVMDCVNPGQLVSAAAYLIDLAAARSLGDWVVPVKSAPDIWSEFLDAGALGSVRCVLPRPATDDFTLPSYRVGDGELGPRRRLTDLPVWPLPQLRRWRHGRIFRSRLRVEVV